MLASFHRALLHSISRFLAIALALCVTTGAAAQGSYPDRPIRLVIPFAPGGETDIFARTISGKLGDVLDHGIDLVDRGFDGGDNTVDFGGGEITVFFFVDAHELL